MRPANVLQIPVLLKVRYGYPMSPAIVNPTTLGQADQTSHAKPGLAKAVTILLSKSHLLLRISADLCLDLGLLLLPRSTIAYGRLRHHCRRMVLGHLLLRVVSEALRWGLPLLP